MGMASRGGARRGYEGNSQLAKAERQERSGLCAMRDWKNKLRPDCVGP